MELPARCLDRSALPLLRQGFRGERGRPSVDCTVAERVRARHVLWGAIHCLLMVHYVPKSAPWVALLLAMSACAPGKVGSGCGADHRTGDNLQRTGAKSATTNPLRQARLESYEKPTRPTAENTGPYDEAALKASEALMITTDGAVYENIDVKGDIWIDADEVTIRNFRVDASGEYYGIKVLDGHRGILVEDGEIHGMSGAGVLGVGYTARRLHIHDSLGDGIKAQGKARGPTLVESCFIEKLGRGEGAHADGNQTQGGADITFRYNNIYVPSPGTPGYPGRPYKSNAAFMLSGEVANLVIERNWLVGGSYTIYCVTDNGGVAVRDNRFGRENDGLAFGKEHLRVVSGKCDAWSGNVWHDTGTPVPAH